MNCPRRHCRPQFSILNSLAFTLLLATAAPTVSLVVAAHTEVTPPGSVPQNLTPNILSWSTNGPAIYATVLLQATNALTNSQPLAGPKQSDGGSTLNFSATNTVFDHFLPGSLNHAVWTNFIAHTNGRNLALWSVRLHPPDWPTKPPVVAWNTNSLLWGMKGLTALSPCWEVEGYSGQVPVTALSRRHGYTRGHGLGHDGTRTNFAGKKVWFLTTDNVLVEATVRREVVRSVPGGARRDYTLLLFSKDLPVGIEPLRVVAWANLYAKYPRCNGAPYPIFKTEQGGNVSAEVPGFSLNAWKAGDSGSPDLLPLPGELVFLNGRSTSGPSAQMQADMDTLCALENLNTNHYQLQWVDLSAYPSLLPR